MTTKETCCYCWNKKAEVIIFVAYEFDLKNNTTKKSAEIHVCKSCHEALDNTNRFPYTDIASVFD